MSIAEKFEVIADEVFEAGKKTQHDEFWKGYIPDKDKISNRFNLFAGPGWNENTFYPPHDLVLKGSPSQTFYYFAYESNPMLDFAQRLEDCGVVMDTSQALSLTQTFRYMYVTRLPKVSTISVSGMLDRTFLGNKATEIEELVLKSDGSQTFNQTFDECINLKIIKITGVIGNSIGFPDSSKLSSLSVDSIIGALKKLATGDGARAITFHSTVKTNMTESQKAIIAEKGWTLA